MINTQLRVSFFITLASFFISSCNTIDLYEKTASVPGHKWTSAYKPEFSFTIKDTAVPYNVFFVIRHTEKYNYNNLFINLWSKQPGEDSLRKQQLEIVLATNDKGWLGTAMDDIYEQRIRLSPNEGSYFPKSGNYIFSLEQIMREQPLEHIMNVGLRIEKKL
jgi:gliding motility-associated lipoprotein GldH